MTKININLVQNLAQSPYIKTDIKPSEDYKSYKLLTFLNSPVAETTVRDNILIYINGNNDPALEIPLYARVK